ncbi:MAG: 3-phosphoglycerate dehydrogenase [Chloroflexi bacterium]|nr:3-phosphoglycerate dehydrogenase [Chloroflexota bacterium]
MKLVVLCKYDRNATVLMQHLAGHETQLVKDRSSLAAALVDADVLLLSNAGLAFRFVDEAVLAAAPRLRLVQLFGVGWDALDLDAATRRGIPVASVPGANNMSVAEIALFLLFAVAKKARLMERAWREGRLGVPEGVELCGKTLCIVGFGRIGLMVAVRARALGMNVVVVNRSANWAMAKAVGAQAAYGVDELPEALRQADAVLLTVPLDEATRGMMNAATLAAMPPGSFLVNVARGAVVERAALAAALDSGHLAGYGTDVWWEEPARPDDPLLQRDDVFFAPHIGGATAEAMALQGRIIRENLDRVAGGLPPRHLVNARVSRDAGR